MKIFLLAVLVASSLVLAPAWGQLSSPRKSSLSPEPGTIDVEDLLPKPVLLKILREAPVYSRATLEHALGSMAPSTQVKLVGLADQACRVRGRARHGDVAGWVRLADLQLPDPDLLATERKLRAIWGAVSAALESRDFRPRPSGLCRFCAHRDLCPEGGGTVLLMPAFRVE